jgi:CBS domain-containing protein
MAAVMSAARVPLLAVVDAGRFVGVVTVNRLVRLLMA